MSKKKKRHQSPKTAEALRNAYGALDAAKLSQPEPTRTDQADERKYKNGTHRTKDGSQMRVKYLTDPLALQITSRADEREIQSLTIEKRNKVLFRAKDTKKTDEGRDRITTTTILSKLPDKIDWLNQKGEVELANGIETAREYQYSTEDYFGIPRDSLAID